MKSSGLGLAAGNLLSSQPHLEAGGEPTAEAHSGL